MTDGKTPIPQANVFLSNTTSGATTSSEGTFILRGLKPGQYTLVVSIVGYQDYTKDVFVGSQPIRLDVQLSNQINELREVTITTPANWKKYYDWFVRDFIGTDENAKYCIVGNPHILNFNYHRADQELEAYTEDFLVIDNLGLGYRIKYLLNEFKSSKVRNEMAFSGKQLFSDLPGSKKQKEIWRKKRDSVYYGSSMHFYRALYQNKLEEEGFQMLKLKQELNPNRLPDKIIQEKIKKFRDSRRIDSANYWIDIINNMSIYYHQNLDRTPVAVNSIVYRTQDPNIFEVDFSDFLYVRYVYKFEEIPFRDVYQPMNLPNYETSMLSIKKPYLFDTNGVAFGEDIPLTEGSWAKYRLSDMLPNDFTPDPR